MTADELQKREIGQIEQEIANWQNALQIEESEHHRKVSLIHAVLRHLNAELAEHHVKE